MLLSSVISLPIFFQNVFNFSPNWALVFLSTTAGSSGWRGRDRQVAKDKKGGNLFPLFSLFASTENQRNHRWKKKPGTLSNACFSAHAYQYTPSCHRGLQKSPPLFAFITCSYLIHYQAERRLNFHFSPAQVHSKWIVVTSYTVLCRSNIIHSSLSSS